MHTIDNLLSSQLVLSKMDILILKKTLAKKLAKDSSCTFITPNKLDIKIHSLINTINIAITLAIFKTRLSSKLVSRFDKKYKKIQIKARRLKRFWKKEEIKKSWENFQTI